MLVGADARFAVDPVEIERAGLSYTVDTLDTFARRFPSAERFFLVGEDAMTAFAAWREPEQIMTLGARRDTTRDRARPQRIHRMRQTGRSALSTRLMDVSSTEIRERVRAGKSIRGFVPESVARIHRGAAAVSIEDSMIKGLISAVIGTRHDRERQKHPADRRRDQRAIRAAADVSEEELRGQTDEVARHHPRADARARGAGRRAQGAEAQRGRPGGARADRQRAERRRRPRRRRGRAARRDRGSARRDSAGGVRHRSRGCSPARRHEGHA